MKKNIEFDSTLLIRNKPEVVTKNPFIEKYINEKLIFDFYNVKDNEGKTS